MVQDLPQVRSVSTTVVLLRWLKLWATGIPLLGVRRSVRGSELRAEGSRFQDLGCRILNLGFRVRDLVFRI
jgi:hypothetical protein